MLKVYFFGGDFSTRQQAALVEMTCGGSVVPVGFPNVCGQGDSSTPLRCAQNDTLLLGVPVGVLNVCGLGE